MTVDRSDNLLALSQVVARCERLRLPWDLFHDPFKVTPEFRYEFRLHDTVARGIYRGSTATMAATAAQDAMNAHRIGWDADEAQERQTDA